MIRIIFCRFIVVLLALWHIILSVLLNFFDLSTVFYLIVFWFLSWPSLSFDSPWYVFLAYLGAGWTVFNSIVLTCFEVPMFFRYLSQAALLGLKDSIMEERRLKNLLIKYLKDEHQRTNRRKSDIEQKFPS